MKRWCLWAAGVASAEAIDLAVKTSFGRRLAVTGPLEHWNMADYHLLLGYHPDMIVQFEGIKTRGDATCRFRISMPSKQRPGEPPFVGYTGKDV